MQFAWSSHHRRSVIPGGIRIVQVDHFCSRRRIYGAIGLIEPAGASTRQQNFAIVIHDCRPPIPRAIVAIPDRTPTTSASNVEVASSLAWARTKHLSVRRDKHVRIEREFQVRTGKVAPRTGSHLPYLRFNVSRSRIDRTANHQHVAIWKRCARRIPATVVHVWQPSPAVINKIENVSIR